MRPRVAEASKTCPLVEAGGELGPQRIHKLLSLVKWEKIQADLRSYLENLDGCLDAFQDLSVAYVLTWKDGSTIFGQTLSNTGKKKRRKEAQDPGEKVQSWKCEEMCAVPPGGGAVMFCLSSSWRGHGSSDKEELFDDALSDGDDTHSKCGQQRKESSPVDFRVSFPMGLIAPANAPAAKEQHPFSDGCSSGPQRGGELAIDCTEEEGVVCYEGLFPPGAQSSSVRALPSSGLWRMAVTVLFMITYISVAIKAIVACSAHMCKQATKIVSKEMLQTHTDAFHSDNTVPHISMKILHEVDVGP
ncbi:hypothetical protein CB1_000877009 [Camelus ferus]|nr:hypothetical protein CB1_000877009 [Camelus ferus]